MTYIICMISIKKLAIVFIALSIVSCTIAGVSAIEKSVSIKEISFAEEEVPLKNPESNFASALPTERSVSIKETSFIDEEVPLKNPISGLAGQADGSTILGDISALQMSALNNKSVINTKTNNEEWTEKSESPGITTPKMKMQLMQGLKAIFNSLKKKLTNSSTSTNSTTGDGPAGSWDDEIPL